MTDPKSIFASKTFWLNAAGGLLAFAQSQGLFALIPAPYLPLAMAGLNIANRFLTTQPVALVAPPR